MLLCQNNEITADNLALPNMQSVQKVQPLESVFTETKPLMQYASVSAQASDNNLTLDEAEKNMLIQALEASRYNVSEAARKLGITRMTMRYRMQKHNL